MTGTISKTTRAEYDAIDADNFSSIKHLAKSPFHYRHRDESREDTDAMQRGRITHLAVFEPDRFKTEVAVWDKRRYGDAFDHFCQDNAGSEIVTPAMFNAAKMMGHAARFNDQSAFHLTAGKAEVTVRWVMRPDGQPYESGSFINAKARLDFIGRDAIVDLKTCADASPEGFGRAAWRNHYHVQAAYYVDGVAAATGRVMPYVIIAVESTAPYVVQVYRVAPEILEAGRDTYRGWLATLHRCRTENKWPGYAEHETELLPPRWAMPNEDGIEEMGLTFNGETT